MYLGPMVIWRGGLGCRVAFFNVLKRLCVCVCVCVYVSRHLPPVVPILARRLFKSNIWDFCCWAPW
jgi:hypothetical protein